MVQLQLSREEVQEIINALAARPYRQVAELIPKILNQANAQLPPEPKPDADPED
jgi:DNA-binding GntR family transcriptional regulator